MLHSHSGGRISPMPSPRGRTWSVGSVESSSGYESAADEPIHVGRALLIMSRSDAHDIIPLAKCLRGYHVNMVCNKDTVEVLAREGIASIDLEQYVNSGRLEEPSLYIHPRVLEGITVPRGITRRRSVSTASAAGSALPPASLSDHQHWSSTGSNCSGVSGKDGNFLPSPRPRLRIDAVVLGFPNLHEDDGSASVPGLAESIDVEKIDLLRVTARALRHCVVCSRPSHTQLLIEEISSHNGCTTRSLRTRLAAQAFEFSATYERAIAAALAAQCLIPPPVVRRQNRFVMELNHGQNPHQIPAALLRIHDRRNQSPHISIVSGSPGYNTLLEALEGWKLVSEVGRKLMSPCCASYKSGIPVGVAIDVPLMADEARSYGIHGNHNSLTPLGVAVVRARNSDPILSHCDLVILSEALDGPTAHIIARGQSIGVVAPYITEEARALLAPQRGGNFVLIQVHRGALLPAMEFRQVGGVALAQPVAPDFEPSLMKRAASAGQQDASPPAVVARDMTLCAIVIKHCLPASAVIAINGATVALSCAQPTAVAAMQIAERRLQVWWARQHPQVLSLPFRENLSSSDRVKLSTQYASGELVEGTPEFTMWINGSFDSDVKPPLPFSSAQIAEHMQTLQGAVKVACMACSSGDWTCHEVINDVKWELSGALRIARNSKATHLGLPQMSSELIESVEECNRIGNWEGELHVVRLSQRLTS